MENADLYDDLPPTFAELEAKRNTQTLVSNARREARRLRATNYAKGHAEPKPGDVLQVQLDGSVTGRGRAGIRFERNARIALVVIGGTDDEVRFAQRAGRREAGNQVISVMGAEQIFEDTALHVFAAPMTPDDVEELKVQNASLEEELKIARAEAEDLRVKMRAARMSAPESTDGRPTRLAAARDVKAKAETSAPATSEFGAPAPTTPSTK